MHNFTDQKLLFISGYHSVCVPFRSMFSIGHLIMVHWKNGLLYRAKVLKLVKSRVRVNYIGYKKRWDEWVDITQCEYPDEDTL